MKIRMELQSDAIPGSGEGTAGRVDTDIVHDEFGLPIIPAKRIKGILRDSSRDLQDAGILNNHHTEAIFGKTGQQTGTEVKISDGYLENYSELRKFLEFCLNDNELYRIFNREAVLNFYTYSRSQTTIDEHGVAKNDTLRTCRVLKKGLVFNFDVECPVERAPDIETICKVTRKFGISRTRGMGEIVLTVSPLSQPLTKLKPTYSEEIKNDELCKLKFKIHNMAQLLVSIQVGNKQVTENYIPGTLIRGALANAFIKHAGLNFSSAHTDTNFRNIFLNEQVVFSNAYPADPSGQPCYPPPVSFVKEKDKENYFDMANEDDFNRIIRDNLQTKGTIGEFVIMNNQGEVSTQSVLTEVAYHHQRPDDRNLGHAKEGAGEFFQFTVLKPDQHFLAHITGNYGYLKRLLEVISKEKTVYLGKSRTAQYGKCEIEDIVIEKLDSPSPSEWQQGEVVVFTLESDTILRNENGLTVPDPRLLINEIAQLLNTDQKNLEIENAFLKFKEIGGFSGVWNMPRIQSPALACGSVMVCRNKGNPIADISSLENHSFGIRTDEGFGKIKVNWHGKEQIRCSEDRDDPKPSIPDNLEKSADLIRHILYSRLEDALKKQAVQNASKNLPVTNSFVSRVILLVKMSDNFNGLNNKLSNLKARAINQIENIAGHLFLKKDNQTIFTVDNDRFIKKIAELRDSSKVEKLRSYVMRMSGIAEEFYNNDVFNLYQTYSIHFLTLLRLHNRKAGNRGKR